MALKYGVVKKSGSWFQYDGSKLGQGMEGSRKFLKENPKIMKKIKEEIKKNI